jgi:hypothetical protein
MAALRSRPTAPKAVARVAKPRAAAPAPAPMSQATADLAAAAAAAGADVSSGADFMEISFPPPAGAGAVSGPPAQIARTPAGPQIAREPANAPRPLGRPGGAAVAARAVAGSSGGSGGAQDSVVSAVLRAMREENEHLGILDGIDPLF